MFFVFIHLPFVKIQLRDLDIRTKSSRPPQI